MLEKYIIPSLMNTAIPRNQRLTVLPLFLDTTNTYNKSKGLLMFYK